MIDMEKLYEKFCGALPETLELTEDKKKKAFEFLFKVSYQYLMRDIDK